MKKVITHSGSFHTDDVFAVATLQLHFGLDNIEVIRTRDEEVIKTGNIVVDVGGIYDPERGRFDHHQNGAPIRDDGVPYSALGMIWKEYGKDVCGDAEVANEIERRLVLPIDAVDNGVNIFESKLTDVNPVVIQDVIALQRPVSDDEDVDECFFEACNIARQILKRMVAHIKVDLLEKKIARDVYENTEDKRILVSDTAVSSHLFTEYSDCLFLISPRDDGNWKATALRISNDSFATRKPFPDSWRGLRDQELADVSGIPDAIFCHKTGYLFVARSKEGVLVAVQKTLA